MKSNNKSKSNILLAIVCIFLLIGIAFLIYPVLGNIMVSIEQASINNEYKQNIKHMDEDKREEELKKAEEYNENLGSQVVEDPFNEEAKEETTQTVKDKYYSALNIGDDEIMGTVEIPSINVDLPIYHGTSEIALQKGIGHLEGTSLPVGGINTHCVLTGHSALPNAKMFTDLEDVVKGDFFYVTEIGKTLAYKVVRIKVVEANDSSDLGVTPNKDYVTLLTCTPYGINTHRLLVTGQRDLVEEKRLEKEKKELDQEDEEKSPVKQAVDVVTNDPALMNSIWLVLGILLIVIIIIISSIVSSRKNKKKQKE